MKRIKSHVGALVGLLIGAAAATAGAAPIHLQMYTGYEGAQSGPAKVFDQYLAAYEKANPGIQIKDLGKDDGSSKLLAMIVSGNAPDIIAVNGETANSYMHEGLLAPIPTAFADVLQKQLLPLAVEQATYHGQLMEVPLEAEDTALLYNTERLQQLGIGDIPKTWTDFAELGRKVTVVDANGRVTGPAVTVGGSDWELGFLYIGMLKAEGGTFVDGSGKLQLDTPAGYNTLSLLVDALHNRPYMSTKMGAFCSGASPFAISFPWERYCLKGDHGQFKSTLIPAGSAGYGASYYSHILTVPKGTKHPEEAWKLLEWLVEQKQTNETTALGHVMATLGSLPMSRDDLHSPYFAHLQGFLSGFIHEMNYAVPMSAYLQYGLAPNWGLTGKVVQQVALKNVAPQEAMKGAITQLQAQMDKWAKG